MRPTCSLRYCFFVAVTLFIGAVKVSGQTIAANEQKQEIKIGLIAPFSGQLAHLGQEPANLFALMLPEMNHFSTHYTIKLVAEDGKCGIGNSAASAAQKLISIDKVPVIVTACSGETFQTAPIADRHKVVVMAYASNHPDIRDLGGFVFRTYPDIRKGIELLDRYINSSKYSSIALITDDNSFTQGIKRTLSAVLGPKLVFSEDIEADAVDFRSLLLKARQKAPQAYYFNCAGPRSCTIVINQARQLGIKESVLSYFYPEMPEVLEATGANADGIVVIGAPRLKQLNHDYDALYREYLDRYKVEPQVEFILRTAHTAMVAIQAAIEASGPSGEKISDFLYSYRAESALGPISFDWAGDIVGVGYELRRIKDKHSEPILVHESRTGH